METPPDSERMPSWKELRDESTECVRMKAGRDGAEVIVYENGYVLYHIQKRYTVFPINLENSYTYSSVADQVGDPWADENITQDCFEDAEWYLLLILIGEDRLQENMNRSYRAKCIPEGEVCGDVVRREKSRRYYSSQMEDDLLLEEQIRELLSLLNERQRAVVLRVFWEEFTHQEIADEMGLKSKSSVTKMLGRAISTMRDGAEEEKGKNFKKISRGRNL